MINELLFLGIGIMLGAGTPIMFRQDYSKAHWVLHWVGLTLAMVGAIL